MPRGVLEGFSRVAALSAVPISTERGRCPLARRPSATRSQPEGPCGLLWISRISVTAWLPFADGQDRFDRRAGDLRMGGGRRCASVERTEARRGGPKSVSSALGVAGLEGQPGTRGGPSGEHAGRR